MSDSVQTNCIDLYGVMCIQPGRLHFKVLATASSIVYWPVQQSVTTAVC